MGVKRKFGTLEDTQTGNIVAKPPPGTRTFASGKAVLDGLAAGSAQALVAFHQQILTVPSALPLPITHPTVLILQNYLGASPTLDEVFNAWREGDRTRNEIQIQAAVGLLSHIILILTPLPFFRSSVAGVVKKLIAPAEPYHEHINRLIHSGKREHVLLGLQLVSLAVHVDPPNPATGSSHGSSGRLAIKVWSMLVEGGSARIIGKILGMRRRNKEGMAQYGTKDPMDRPDIRHAALHLILPLLSLPAFHAHAKTIIPSVYSNLSADPPITIYRILTALWSAITGPSGGLARRSALALLDENAVEHLLSLLSQEVIESTSGRTVADMTMCFLVGVTATPGQGICFPDEGWYPRWSADDKLRELEGEGDGMERGGRNKDGKMRKGLHNRILSNVVKKVGARAVGGNGKVGDWVIEVLQACPELVAGYWPYSALSLEPRLDARWLATVSYIGRIISLPIPPGSTFREPIPKSSDDTFAPARQYPPSIAIMVESIFPSPLGKVHLTKGLQHTDTLVQHVTGLSMARALQKLDVVQVLFRSMEAEVENEIGSTDNPWSKGRFELEMECRKRVPDVLVVIAFAQKSATLARVHPDSDDEPEPSLVARSVMLTEVALRLFGLYHRTLPSISRESKFDIGKLLVSASSAKAERRERREAREGSVVSDGGSVVSVGTVGTVGMGGGFGQARGDVEGFEALSQAHVLSLLGQVRDWQWMNKAAGSQYSYLYHILILHLSTPHPITKHMTTALLQKLLLPSILFEHDPSEFEVWLNALPTSSSKGDISQRAQLLVEQIHLLSFIDDCARRCMKTPYKYIQDIITLVPAYFAPTIRSYELLTPLLVTTLEQLHAKILGQHISTEAAGVVVGYLGRVMLKMTGKMRDGHFLFAVVDRLSQTIQLAREKGQERKGLSGAVQSIRSDLNRVFRVEGKMDVDGDESPKLVDEETWKQTCFERQLLDSDSTQASLPESFHRFLGSASSGALERYGRFSVHLMSNPLISSSILLAVIQLCLRRAKGVHATRLRTAVFECESIRRLLLYSKGDPGAEYRQVLDDIVRTLRKGEKTDEMLGRGCVHDLLESASGDKKGKNLVQILTLCHPWTRFMTPQQARQGIEVVVKHPKRLAGLGDRTTETLSGMIKATNDPTFALGHLDLFVSMGIYNPFIHLLKAASKVQTAALTTNQDLTIQDQAIEGLLRGDSTDAVGLVEEMVVFYPSAVDVCVKIFGRRSNLQLKPEMLPIMAKLLDLPLLRAALPTSHIIKTAVDVLLSAAETSASIFKSAVEVIVNLVQEQGGAAELAVSINTVSLSSFNLRLVQLLRRLLELGRQPDLEKTSLRLAHLALEHTTRACSNDNPLNTEQLSIMEELIVSFRTYVDIELDIGLVEPVITAVIQERLNEPIATDLAALLVEKSFLKASFVRQQLNLLLASKAYSRLALYTDSSANRHGFIHLLSALFLINPYVSCQPNIIEQLLPLYRGTLSKPDQELLSLFQMFEGYRHVSVQSVLKCWSASGPGGKRTLDALTSLEPARVFATCISFPLRRHLRIIMDEKNVGGGGGDGGEGLYDPAFVLPLFAAVLQEGLSGLDWVEMLRTNVSGLAVMSLSSRDAGMRRLGGHILARTMVVLGRVRFQERAQLVYILRLVRHSIPAPSEPSTDSPNNCYSQPRLPVLITTFLAHVLRTLASPSNTLYPAVSRFLLQRSVFDPVDVPMLFGMLYASGEGHKRDRAWIVRLIRDAARSDADWRVLKRRKTVSLLETLYQSSIDMTFRKLVLQAMERITRLPPACLSLAHRNHFISWLSSQWLMNSVNPLRSADDEKTAYLGILENVVIVLVDRERENGDRLEKSQFEMDVGTGWIWQVERLLEMASEDADLERLQTVSRIFSRLTTIPYPSSAPRLFIPLVKRLKELCPDHGTDAAYVASVEYLFEASLSLPCAAYQLRDPVDDVGQRVAVIEGNIGDWIRIDKRRCQWEKWSKSQSSRD